jgi:acyl-coenzyme A thioesterase PaaI-like protein
MAGKSNPVAPPMGLAMEGEVAVGSLVFGPQFEGAPGFVHGGMIAAAFDQVFGYLQVSRGIGSLTAELSVRYLRPTPLLMPLRFEARFDRAEGKKSYVSARLFAGDSATAEATGLFVEVDNAKLTSLLSGRG